ncbi:LysE family transporter [Kitasatospora sp. NPDC101183]|uniref:LysE family transporter n=1 Tax=Kitasatospora sp. NPDC101183 TaxID=3364100 RepID=UPI003805F888
MRALVTGLLAGYGVAVPVGAVGAYLVSLTARTSLRTGACAALGVATADGLYALLAVLGGTGLAPLLTPVAGPLRLGAAVVLPALAARTAVTALRTSGPLEQRPPPSPARAYLALLGLTLLNPLTVLSFAALILADGARAGDTPARLVFVAAVLAASASWQLLLAAGGALLGRALTGPRGRLATALASAALVGWLAVRLLFDALP